MCMCMCMHMCMCMCMRMCMRMHMYMYMYVYVYVPKSHSVESVTSLSKIPSTSPSCKSSPSTSYQSSLVPWAIPLSYVSHVARVLCLILAIT